MRPLAGLLVGMILLGCTPRPGPVQPGSVSELGRFDTDLELAPIHGNKSPFSELQGKKLSIYYLSVKCPHCRTAAPAINEARKHLDSLGYTSVNILIKFNEPADLPAFAEETGIQGLHFHDHARKFGSKYGMGTIPVFFLVDEQGGTTRFNPPIGDSLPARVKEKLAACCTDR